MVGWCDKEKVFSSYELSSERVDDANGEQLCEEKIFSCQALLLMNP